VGPGQDEQDLLGPEGLQDGIEIYQAGGTVRFTARILAGNGML
jgi:hypothetical protein